jgi:putative transposase
MIRSFLLRLRPTKEQISSFDFILRDSCETYNAALQERKEAWKLERKSINYADQCAELTELRKDPAFGVIALDIQREPLRRINRSFQDFFRRCRQGSKSPGFPRYRSLDRYNSFAWHDVYTISADHVRVPNVGLVKFKAHRNLEGKPKQVTVKRDGDKWVARILCDIGNAPDKVPLVRQVGIDLGITSFITGSDGSEVKNQKFGAKRAEALARAQRAMSRKLKRSNNRKRAKRRVQREYKKQSESRKNFCHHASKEIINNYDLIVHENLKISSMVRSSFAKSINDAAWAIFLFQLVYKAESAGRTVLAVNPRRTSQTCSGCGIVAKKAISERWHSCQCGASLGRDHNAAINILALGRSAVGSSAEGRSVHYPIAAEGKRL